jgi:hypothetical protein
VTNNRVVLVLDSDFGERLRVLDLSVPVWIVGSDKNTPVVGALRAEKKAADITTFVAQPLEQLADTVDQHHPAWTEFEIYGVPADDAEEALADYMPGQFTAAKDGLIFCRTA